MSICVRLWSCFCAFGSNVWILLSNMSAILNFQNQTLNFPRNLKTQTETSKTNLNLPSSYGSSPGPCPALNQRMISAFCEKHGLAFALFRKQTGTKNSPHEKCTIRPTWNKFVHQEVTTIIMQLQRLLCSCTPPSSKSTNPSLFLKNRFTFFMCSLSLPERRT